MMQLTGWYERFQRRNRPRLCNLVWSAVVHIDRCQKQGILLVRHPGRDGFQNVPVDR